MVEEFKKKLVSQIAAVLSIDVLAKSPLDKSLSEVIPPLCFSLFEIKDAD